MGTINYTMSNPFADHNAEQKRVWDALHAGKPIRVPVLIECNARMILLDPKLNPDGTTFEQYTLEPETMLRVMLDFQYWMRHHLRFDHEMGVPADGWRIWVDFQNFHEAAWLGAPVHFPETNCPYASPLLDDDNRNMLFDRGIPDPFEDGGWMQRNWAVHDYMRAKMEAGFAFHGRPIADVLPAGVGTDTVPSGTSQGTRASGYQPGPQECAGDWLGRVTLVYHSL